VGGGVRRRVYSPMKLRHKFYVSAESCGKGGGKQNKKPSAEGGGRLEVSGRDDIARGG